MKKEEFLKRLKEGFIVFDGATGTMLQALGLEPGGCPDELSLKRPELVEKVHRLYREAGSDVVTTNTFGANRVKLKEYGLENRLRDINIAAVRIARAAVGDGFVAGCIGPTGKFVEPVGDMGFDTMVDVFTEQAEALKEGGADLIIIETMMDIKELKAAIIGAKETGLPVVATMTFDDSMRTVLGTPPEVFAIVGEALGVTALGANCSLGAEGIYRALSKMSPLTTLPLIAQPNAGIPVLEEGKTIFPATPEEMADHVPALVGAGARIIGGCCGTTPEHIKQMKRVLETLKPEERKKEAFTKLASRTTYVTFGAGRKPVVIGERINPTGRKKFAEELKEGKTLTIRREAREQKEAGAHALDVNVGVPGIDEKTMMRRAVFCVNDNADLPVVIDSSSVDALEEGLKAVDGKALVNSVSGEEKKLKEVLPLVKKYGASVIALTLDEKGIPESAEERVRIAEKIIQRATSLGIPKEDIIVDCLAITVSAEPKAAGETLRAIREVKRRFAVPTVLGVSNISFGLPHREVINSTFFAMALEAGLDCAIINPKNRTMMDTYYAAMLLTGFDTNAEEYIRRFRETPENKVEKAKEEKPLSIEERLAKAVVEGDEAHIVELVEEALKSGMSPMDVGNLGLIKGLEEVGRRFADGRYFLPQVILSAETVKKGFERLKEEFKGKGGPKLGKVIMATVEGDIHDIGKNIVCTLLENHGFEVYDLGKNVPAEKIVEEAKRLNADIVGLSALMTTTVMEMDNVIKKLKESGVKVKTIVGGAVVTPEFAKKIGAEYGGDATEAVEKMKRLLGKA